MVPHQSAMVSQLVIVRYVSCALQCTIKDVFGPEAIAYVCVCSFGWTCKLHCLRVCCAYPHDVMSKRHAAISERRRQRFRNCYELYATSGFVIFYSHAVHIRSGMNKVPQSADTLIDTNRSIERRFAFIDIVVRAFDSHKWLAI